ncbi:MAG: hypothetical protein ACYC7L_13380 [Nitrospirota bacterium]
MDIRLMLKAAPYIAIAVAGGLIVWFVEEGRLNTVRAELQVRSKDLDQCVAVARNNDDALEKYRSQQTFVRRKDSETMRLQQAKIVALQDMVNTLTAPKEATHATGTSGRNGDAVLSDLNRMFLSETRGGVQR